MEKVSKNENKEADALAKLGSQKEAVLLGIIPLRSRNHPVFPRKKSCKLINLCQSHG